MKVPQFGWWEAKASSVILTFDGLSTWPLFLLLREPPNDLTLTQLYYVWPRLQGRTSECSSQKAHQYRPLFLYDGRIRKKVVHPSSCGFRYFWRAQDMPCDARSEKKITLEHIIIFCEMLIRVFFSVIFPFSEIESIFLMQRMWFFFFTVLLHLDSQMSECI